VSKNLIIVESPAKTRTLKKFLGRGWDVRASLGHIRDLAKKDLGIDEDYEPKYVVLANKKDVVSDLKKAAKGADVVYLAPDPDREGEAIAWHIAEVLGRDAKEVKRVTFNEITKPAVLRALANPANIDARKVDAQQARRVLDRLMGFRLSPLLWEKVKQGLSAGRVQSVALKMVCERQAEIDAFVSEEYWLLGARLEGKLPPSFLARLQEIDGRKAAVGNGDDAARIAAELLAGQFRVKSIERKESRQNPSPPFITSRLQQEAARRFGFTVKRTMALAQGLYEGVEVGDRGQLGLITYMRTDSTRVADEALDAGRAWIAATWGEAALPAKPNRYKSKSGAQDAHEAIRPTYFDLPPEALRDVLQPDQLKLYKLIWDRFIASQMLPAIFDVTQVDVENGRYTLRATGKVMKSPGFLAVYREVTTDESPASDDDATLPALAVGETLRLLELAKEQKFTQPPAQYSEATLVRALEENGIGRPSTYAQILTTITEREYVEKAETRFRPTPLGKLVNQLLQGSFHDIINEGYTAELEARLDEIEEGRLEWKRALREFDLKFTSDLEQAGKVMPNVKREGIPTDEVCPKCGGVLRLRFGRFGGFLGCTNYPTCDYTRNLEEASPSANGSAAKGEAGATETAAASPEAADVAPCEKCGRPMALRRSRFGTFYGCTGYPECKNLRKLGPAPAAPKPTGVPCPECRKGMIEEKKSRRGKIFYSCNRYPDCKFALWDRPIAQPCPQCGTPFVLEKTTKKAGTRLVCSKDGCDYSEAVVGGPGE
jgi:DNA topoisomerase-1